MLNDWLILVGAIEDTHLALSAEQAELKRGQFSCKFSHLFIQQTFIQYLLCQVTA